MMSTPSFLSDPDVSFAIQSVSKACQLAEDVQKAKDSLQMTKEDRSPVTVADFSVQALMGYYFSKSFPKDCVMGEESAEALASDSGKTILEQVRDFVASYIEETTEGRILSWIDQGQEAPCREDRFWVLDPIDGTRGFVRGDHYAIALALVENGEVVMGILGCPNLNLKGETDYEGVGTVAVARRGCGAWLSSLDSLEAWMQLKVSDNNQMKDMRLLRSVEKTHTHIGRTEKLLTHLGVEATPIAMDSQAKYLMVSMGLGETFFYLLPQGREDFRMKIWDVAPGSIVIEEAGGKVTDLMGNELNFKCGDTLKKNPGILVSNKILHEDILRGLKQLQLLPL